MNKELIRIGQLAKSLSTTTKTLRFYESIRLIKPTERSSAGYRLYDRNAANRARLVLQMRRLGFTLKELKHLFNQERHENFRKNVLSLMDEKLRETDETLAIIQGRRDDLAARHEALLSTPRERQSNCICDALLQFCSCDAAKSSR